MIRVPANRAFQSPLEIGRGPESKALEPVNVRAAPRCLARDRRTGNHPCLPAEAGSNALNEFGHGDFKARADVELPIDEDSYSFFPSDTLVLSLWTEGSAHAELHRLHLSPLDPQDPWQVESVYTVSRNRQDLPYEVPGQYFSTRAPAAR